MRPLKENIEYLKASYLDETTWCDDHYLVDHWTAFWTLPLKTT